MSERTILNVRRDAMTRSQNKMVRAMLDSTMSAYKNWIASAVESGDVHRAKQLVQELRDHEALCHIFVPDDMWSYYTEGK